MLILINTYYFTNNNIKYEKSPICNINNNIIKLSFNSNIKNETCFYDILNSLYNPHITQNILYNINSLYFNGFSNYIKLICNKNNIFTNLVFNIVFIPNKNNIKQFLIYSKNNISIFIDEKNKLCIKLLTSFNNSKKYSYFISKNNILLYNWNIITIQYIKNNITVYLNNSNICGMIEPGLKYSNLNLNNIIIGMKNNKYYFSGFINLCDIYYNSCIYDIIKQNIIEYIHPYCNWTSTHSDPTHSIQYDLYGKINGTIFNNVKNLQFGNNNQYILFNSDFLTNLQKYSFSIYLKYFINKKIIQNQKYILISNMIYSKNNGFSIILETNNNLQFIVCEIRLLCKRYILKSKISYDLNKWNNIILTYNGNNCMQLYQNYNITNTLTNLKNGIQNNTKCNTYIGGFNNYKSFPGIIDNIRIYNRLLINTEKNYLLNN